MEQKPQFNDPRYNDRYPPYNDHSQRNISPDITITSITNSRRSIVTADRDVVRPQYDVYRYRRYYETGNQLKLIAKEL